MEAAKTAGMSHRLTMEDRRAGVVTGVTQVDSFDEKEILLVTSLGKLQIRGEQLHVRRLDLEKGEVEVEGKVQSLVYLSKNTEKREESLLKRMFG